MIWIWINAVVVFLKNLIIPPMPPATLPVLDENQQCPACGARNGKLTAGVVGGKLVVQHDCKVCKAYWRELPVLKEPIAASSSTVKVNAPQLKE